MDIFGLYYLFFNIIVHNPKTMLYLATVFTFFQGDRMAADFDKQLKGILNSVRSTIDPNYAIPKDKANEPMNVRIQRMKVAADELAEKLKGLTESLNAFTTNLNALTEEVQPYLTKESEQASSSPEAAPAAPATDAKPAEAEAAPAADTKPAEPESAADAQPAAEASDDKKS
jgi:hypothetical protein